MQPPNKQQKKLRRLAEVLDGGDLAVLKHLDSVEEELTSRIDTVQSQIPPINDVLANVKDGKDGYTPVKGKDYFDGQDGYTPKKGIDYFDGKDGRTPIHVGITKPINAKPGDLWYTP